jgi:hypothetical protein
LHAGFSSTALNPSFSEHSLPLKVFS